MKSNLLLTVFLATLCVRMVAQPLHWRESLYDPAKTSTISKEKIIKTEGDRSMKYIFTDDGVPYLICDTFAVTGSSTYNLSVDYLDNDPAGVISVRLWFFASPGTAYLNRYTSSGTVDSPNWQTITLSGTTPATATLAYVAIRMSTGPGWAGSATFYADNLIYTENGGPTSLIVNGDFEEWYIAPGSTVENWRESLYDPAKLSTITNDTDVKSEGFNSLKYVFTDDGVPYFICDTFAVTGNTPYNFSIDYLDNDPAGTISARLWFFASPGTAYLNRYTSSGTVDSPNWQTISLSGTTPATATLAYIAIRMSTGAGWAGSATFNADKAQYIENNNGINLIKNGGFEDWLAPTGAPEFLTYKFETLNPIVTGLVNNTDKTVSLEVPYVTDLTNLVASFTLTEGTTAKVGANDQVSGTTANDFTNPVVYTLTKNATNQDWTVSVSKTAPTTGKDIVTFKFDGLNPVVTGIVNVSNHTVTLEVPNGTNVTALVPTITLSPNASVSPLSGAANNFTSPATYTVTAQDGSTQAWTVTVTFAAAGQTTLFYEDFEDMPNNIFPSGWVLINHDGYTMAAGQERWQDSAWVVSTSSRPELAGTKIAVSSSFCTDMPLETGHADDWMILPKITLGDNSTLSWQAMSLTTSGNYPDDYDVLIAPAVNGVTPTYDYFVAEGNYLLSVDPESWSTIVGRPGTGLSSRSINLKNTITPGAPNGWYNKDVWIAFVLSTDRYTNPDTGIPNASAGGSELAIDNIKVVNSPVTGIREIEKNTLNARVFPNPSTGEFNISLTSEKKGLAEIQVIDLAGKMMYSKSIPVHAGQNQIDMNLSELAEGTYMIKTSLNGCVNISKLIIR